MWGGMRPVEGHSGGRREEEGGEGGKREAGTMARRRERQAAVRVMCICNRSDGAQKYANFN